MDFLFSEKEVTQRFPLHIIQNKNILKALRTVVAAHYQYFIKFSSWSLTTTKVGRDSVRLYVFKHLLQSPSRPQELHFLHFITFTIRDRSCNFLSRWCGLVNTIIDFVLKDMVKIHKWL